MHAANLVKVGDSVMLAVPRELLDELHVTAGSSVELEVKDGRLVLESRRRSRYSLEELLKESDYTGERSDEEKAWLNAPTAGRELL